MASRFRVTLSLPPVPAGEIGEVVSKKISVSVNDGGAVETTLAANAISHVFEEEQGANVNVSLIHVDDAGNPSSPSVREFQIVDNVPPAQPGEIGVQLEELPHEPAPAPQ